MVTNYLMTARRRLGASGLLHQVDPPGGLA